MPTHSGVIVKFTKSLETNFFNKLKRKPNWNVDEIEAEFIKAMIEVLDETIEEVRKGFINLFFGGKQDD